MRISDWSADVCSSDLIVREGKKIALLSLGTRLGEAEAAAAKLDAMGLSTTVADMRFAKPLDLDLVRKLAAHHELLITLEECAIGGLGAHVLRIASVEGRPAARRVGNEWINTGSTRWSPGPSIKKSYD